MSNLRKLILKIVGAVVALGVLGFIAIQFVPVDKSNPPVVSEPKWDSPQTQMLAQRACFDCHSNQTRWPWYSNIAPVSWVMAHNVNEGRGKLNFSEIGLSKGGGSEAQGEGEEGEGGENDEGREGIEIDEPAESIQDGEMPPQEYVALHPDAHLSETEIQALIAGLKATLGAPSKGAMAQ